MNVFILSLIAKYKYLGIFLSIILEQIIPFKINNYTCYISGILLSLNSFSLICTLLSLFIGSVIGSICIYIIGYFFSDFLNINYSKFGIKKIKEYFNSYPFLLTFIYKNTLLLKIILPFLIGSLKISFKKFIIYNILNSFINVCLFTYLGYFLQENFNLVNIFVLFINIFLFLLIYLFHQRKVKTLNIKSIKYKSKC